MYFGYALVSLLLVSSLLQDSTNPIQQRLKLADQYRKAGKATEAEAEYREALIDAYGTLGKLLTAEGEYEKAIKALERAAGDTRSEKVLVDLAIAYFYAGQYEKAIEPLNRALNTNPSNVAAHHMLGKVNFMLRRFDKAATELETAHEAAPDDYDVSYTLALAFLKQKKLDRARQIFDHMVNELGQSPQLHLVFGRAYRETGYLREAIEEFMKVIALDPVYPRAHYYLGLTYLLVEGTKNLKQAEAEFKAELAAHPNEFFSLYNLGLVYVTGRQYEQAISFLERAAQVRPEHSYTYLYLGTSYYGLGQYGKAIAFLQKAMALDPNLRRDAFEAGNAHYLLGQSMVKVGRLQEAEKELQAARDLKASALRRDQAKADAYMKNEEYRPAKFGEGEEESIAAKPNAPQEKLKGELKQAELFYAKAAALAHSELGLLRAERKDFHAAAEQFRQAAEWQPDREGLDYNWGLASYNAESYQEAIAPLERELKAHPANVAARQLLALSYFMVDDYARASTMLQEVVAERPDNIGLYYTLSISLIKQNKTAEANTVIQKMLARGGDSSQVHILLGQAYYGENDTTRALAELNKALEMDPKILTAHYYAGLTYLMVGKFDQATREFQAELSLNPKDVKAKYHLGFILLSEQNTEQGIQLMREVIQQKSDYADARFELGKALLQQKDMKGAIENLEAAAKFGPEKPHILYQLCRAYQTAGRVTDNQKCMETYRQFKDKARNQEKH
jgi:tetratricopeptide (TPR) repeat protein